MANFLRQLFGGTPHRREQVPLYGQQQQQGFEQILQQALQGLQGNQFDFGPIEQQARSGFAQKTIPSIAERFTSMGEGGQGSSAFQGALGRAGAGLEESLGGMKQQYGLQQQGNLMNMLRMGLTPQFQNVEYGREPGMLELMAGPLAKAGMGYFGGGGTFRDLFSGLGNIFSPHGQRR